MNLRPDGTADCDTCHMPMFALASNEKDVTLECANRHRVTLPMPDEPKMRRFIHNWVARRGAQLDEQQRRWESDDNAQ